MEDESSGLPEQLIFDANLQEFAQRVSLICSLEAGGKLSQSEAYQKIRTLWKELKASRKNLGIPKHTERPAEKTDD